MWVGWMRGSRLGSLGFGGPAETGTAIHGGAWWERAACGYSRFSGKPDAESPDDRFAEGAGHWGSVLLCRFG